MAQTWNNDATVFDGISLNVTDAASNANSRLLNLLINGISIYSFRKNGILTINSASGQIQFVNSAYSIGRGAVNSMIIENQVNSTPLDLSANGPINIVSAQGTEAFLGFSATRNNSNPTVRLYRDADGQIGQRNGLNAQTYNIYNTFTNTSNYERGSMRWNGNVFEIGTEALGTGVLRDLRLNSQNRSAYIALPTASEIRDILISFGLMAAS